MRVPLCLLLIGCVEPLEPTAPADETELAVGDSRTLELRAVRLDVEGYEQRVDLDGLRALPPGAISDVWLLDLELTPLVRNTLEQLRDLPYDQAVAQPVAAQNMRTLLRSTPDNVSLEGTQLEEMILLSAALGIPPARALADLLEVGITEPILDLDIAAQATVDGLIASHPLSQVREGPVTNDHPDGLYDVAENSLPITLGDVLSNFDDLPDRFGPADTDDGLHPGFISEADGLSVIEEDFAMTVKVDANALPFKGVDLDVGAVGSVNSIGAQIETLFPTDDPEWLQIEGLVPEPSIETMTVYINEDDTFLPGGDSRDPVPTGDSPAWDLAPWVFEHIVADMTFGLGQEVSAHTVEYTLGTGAVAFRAEVDETGWATFETFDNAGSPPPPAYLWDLMIELGQVRLHDGGLAEGDGDVEFSLDDVPLGVGADVITAQIKDNLAANPSALRGLASALVDASDGAPDVFYVRPPPTDPEAADWLFFLVPEDIPAGDDGPIRPYDYGMPGFFADPGLTEKVSSVVDAAGDDEHEKVQIAPGDVLYVEDDQGRVFQLDIGEKPSLHAVSVTVTRL